MEEWHKGELCPYNNRLCEKGFCSKCEIYNKYEFVRMSEGFIDYPYFVK